MNKVHESFLPQNNYHFLKKKNDRIRKYQYSLKIFQVSNPLYKLIMRGEELINLKMGFFFIEAFNHVR